MTTDLRVQAVAAIATRHLFDLVVELSPRLEMGDGPLGRRILFGSAGGTFHGPRVRGDVLAGGGDWALFRPDGSMALDVRLTLRTDDGCLVRVRNRVGAVRLAERRRVRGVGRGDVTSRLTRPHVSDLLIWLVRAECFEALRECRGTAGARRPRWRRQRAQWRSWRAIQRP
jgi:hypothetical protein